MVGLLVDIVIAVDREIVLFIFARSVGSAVAYAEGLEVGIDQGLIVGITAIIGIMVIIGIMAVGVGVNSASKEQM